MEISYNEGLTFERITSGSMIYIYLTQNNFEEYKLSTMSCHNKHKYKLTPPKGHDIFRLYRS